MRSPARLREPGERDKVEARNERVGRPRPRRDHGDPRGPRGDGRDACRKPGTSERGTRNATDPATLLPPPATGIASARCRLSHQTLGQLPELDDPGRAVGALAAGPPDRVPAVQAQQATLISTHPEAAPGSRDQLGVRPEPGVDLDAARTTPNLNGTVRRRRASWRRRRCERPGSWRWPPAGSRSLARTTRSPRGRSTAGPRRRDRWTPCRREPIGDRVEVLVHTGPRAPGGASYVRGESSVVPRVILAWSCCPGAVPARCGSLPASRPCSWRRMLGPSPRPPCPRRSHPPSAPGCRTSRRPPR